MDDQEARPHPGIATLSQMKDRLQELETAARELPNKHVADIIKGAAGRLHDAIGHPDIGAAFEQLEREHEDDTGQERLQFDPNAGT